MAQAHEDQESSHTEGLVAPAANDKAVVSRPGLGHFLLNILNVLRGVFWFRSPPALESPAKKVVIVGGGIGGSAAAKFLEDVADVTLIDSKEYLEVSWATLRTLVDPGFSQRVYFPHSAYLKKARVVVGVATGIDTEKSIVSVGDDKYPFDYLVLATGRVPPPSLSLEEKLEEVKSQNASLVKAEKVLIVGGGPTGVEMAGEIVTEFPGKSVTLVHGGPRLLPFVGEKASAKALQWLQSRGVSVRLNEKIDTTGGEWGCGGKFKTRSGEEIETDYLAVCTGTRPYTSWLQDAFPSAVENSEIKVEADLSVSGYPNVFAVGDLSSSSQKQGYIAAKQGIVAGANIKELIRAQEKGVSPRKLKTYVASKNLAAAIVSLGRNDGLAYLPIGSFTGWFPRVIKSKDLFTSKIHGDLQVQL